MFLVLLDSTAMASFQSSLTSWPTLKTFVEATSSRRELFEQEGDMRIFLKGGVRAKFVLVQPQSRHAS